MSNNRRADLLASFFTEVRASQNATDALDQAVADYLGINRTDLRCLDVLDREGPLTAGRLAELAKLSPGATTTALDRLERSGLARRTRDTADRRKVLVEVDPSLRPLSEQVYGTPEDGARFLERYTDDQLELLNEFLRLGREWNEGRLELVRSLPPKG